MLEPSKTINLRIKTETQYLIDQAANFTGQSRTEFILEASRQAAINTLLDRSLILVDEEVYKRFLDVLNSPASPTPNLRRLFATPSPWE